MSFVKSSIIQEMWIPQLSENVLSAACSRGKQVERLVILRRGVSSWSLGLKTGARNVSCLCGLASPLLVLTSNIHNLSNKLKALSEAAYWSVALE